MKSVLFVLLALVLAAPMAQAKPPEPNKKQRKAPVSLMDVSVKTDAGADKKLSDYKGRVLLIVNTASKCGYTPQLGGLQTLYTTYNKRGFDVLAFPCNDFGGQEPGTAKEIRDFCEERYETTFPIFQKLNAKGEKKSPLYQHLTEATGPKIRGEIRWNFTKFLVDRSGKVIARYESGVTPSDKQLIADIEAALGPAK